MSRTPSSSDAALPRIVGLPGAIGLGLGSILGTGVFVGLALAAVDAGALILPALALAGVVAMLNGLSSAALAARYPVSGGTYEYGYRVLSPAWGFAAGWLFVAAKCASFAGAALGASAYLMALLRIGDPVTARITAVGIIAGATLLTAAGLKRSQKVNAVMVGVTLVGLAVFVLVCVMGMTQNGIAPNAWSIPENDSGAKLLKAAAFLFVAFTGYGRVATLGEEILDPARNIPRAVVATLVVSLFVYALVATAGLGAAGAMGFAGAAEVHNTSGFGGAAAGAALTNVAKSLNHPFFAHLVAIASITAMCGVALNLSLGISRVVLAMARRGDLPDGLASLGAHGKSPVAATVAVGLVAALLAGLLTVKASWSFSAFTVLVYYAITNLAALRLEPGQRRPAAALGLFACLALAVWVDAAALVAGLGLLAAGFLLRQVFRRWRNPRAPL